MEQLNGMDAGFLNMETPVQRGHVGGVVIVDPSTAPDDWGYDTIRALIQDRIHLLPPFRRRLVTVPFDIDHPYWVEDDAFDLDFHLRHIAVPSPGDAETLATLVARIHERPLDRSRPLWEMYVIEGLDGGRVATYTKLHHAAVDGVSGAEILTILLDTSPDDHDIGVRHAPDRETKRATRVPGQVELLARSALSAAVRPAKAFRLGYEVARSIPGLKPLESLPALVGLGRERDELLSRPSLVAPHTVLNAPITPHRRWAFGDIALGTAKAIKDAAGVTVNDVVIATAAGAVRRWLVENDALPTRSLQAMVPISIRTESEEGDIGNKVSAMIAPIGTHLEDSVERLEFVHQTMQVAKETHQATPATLLRDFAEFTPPAVAARAARLVFRNGRAGRITPFNLVISNVPGPNFPLYLAGAQLEGHYPVSAIIDGAALNITLHSYRGMLCFGLVADRELIPDLWDVMGYVRDEFAALEDRLT
ncbi:MAG: wax ester/triacylglycerol synthase family O-acyltransferase [Acidimicrobiia bacterium]|nr:wax ester/triacylglycerol synthase family O-acyltransferase [Acidimicrobiia bacterium]